MNRLREVVRQLGGIGGGRSLGFGPNRVRSLPDGVGQVIEMYLREKDGLAETISEEKAGGNGGNPLSGTGGGNPHPGTGAQESTQHSLKIGDLCPECGQAAVVNEEGCRKCYACGFSEC